MGTGAPSTSAMVAPNSPALSLISGNSARGIWKSDNSSSSQASVCRLNASRTMLFNLHTLAWDDELLSLFQIPRALLPEIRDSAGEFGATIADVLGAPVPIRGVAGDQQSAAFGQSCFAEGEVKATFGTGCFALVNTGERVPVSANRLLATVAWRIAGRTTYALEGSIFVAG